MRLLKDLRDRVVLAEPSDLVREVLQIIGLDAVFRVYDTRLQALRALSHVTNAHAHLEFGWAADLCPGIEGKPFVSWILGLIERIMQVRQGDWQTTYRKAAEVGIQQLIDAGTTTIGDISSTGLSIEPLLESGLDGVVYVEVLGRDPQRAALIWESARGLIEQWRPKERNGMRIGLSLHAPYSLLPELWKTGLDYARKEALPLCIHAAESQAERDYLERGTGDFSAYYDRLGGTPLSPPGVSPVRYLDDLGALDLKPLLVHAVHVDDDDLRRIKTSEATVVHCPRSNLRLRCGRMPLEAYLLRGIPVYLGTDGLSSSPSLNVLDEADAAAALHHGHVPADVIEGLVHQPMPA
jgi:cytosine/adenosine deaminase-related metal-dependent hydrolase